MPETDNPEPQPRQSLFEHLADVAGGSGAYPQPQS